MGYKKQSKRKSPFKATGYTTHQRGRANFKDLTGPKGAGNRLGEAVGAIGTAIGDAVQTYEANRENKEAASTANPGATEETNKAAAAAFGNVETNVPYTAPNFEAEELPQIGKTTRRPIAPTLKEATPEPESEPTGTGLPNPLSGGTNLYNNPEHKQLPEVQAPAQKSWWEKFKESTGNIVTGAQYSGTTNLSTGENLGNPINRTPFKRITPMLRSPLYATAGKKMGELAQSSLTNISYLGEAGRAGAEGYNSQVDRHNYAQAVQQEQANELDEEFGELEVAPTGFKPYDASVEGLAREWKGEFVDAKKAWKSGKMSNEDWIDTKHRLQGNAASYGKAASNLQQSMKNWIDNKGEISNSTKPETIDFFNTMEKAPDSLTVQNIEGVPTFVGQTLGGKPISMPVDQIANGSAAMRFNTKIDLGKELAPTIKELQGLKTEIDTDQGTGIGNQAWDTPAVQDKVNYNLDKIVNNNAKLRSIAAETYGWDYDQFEERVAADGMDAVKDMVKQELKDDIQESYFPVEKTTRFTQDEQQQQQKINTAAQREQRLSGGSRTQQKKDYQAGVDSKINAPGGMEALNKGLPPGFVAKKLKGKLVIAEEIKDDDGDVTGHTIITGSPYDFVQKNWKRGEESPTKRTSPFRRVMSYINSTFKRDKGKDEPKADDTVNLREELEERHRAAGGRVTESGGLVNSSGALAETLAIGGAAAPAATMIAGGAKHLYKAARAGKLIPKNLKQLKEAANMAGVGTAAAAGLAVPGAAHGAGAGFALEALGEGGEYLYDKTKPAREYAFDKTREAGVYIDEKGGEAIEYLKKNSKKAYNYLKEKLEREPTQDEKDDYTKQILKNYNKKYRNPKKL